MQRPILAKSIRVLILLAVPALYLYGLNHLPLMGSDEPRYAQVAREMFVRGDPITPTLGGHVWFEKPALLYWMMMTSFRLFGVSEWSARLGPALCGIGTVFITWCLLIFVRRREKGNEGGSLCQWVAAALASCGGMLVFSRGASFDIVLTMTVTSALACFFMADVETENKRRGLLLTLFYASVGASLLAKGLLGIVLPCLVIGCYYLFQRAWPDTRIMRSTFWGVPLALLVGSCWYAPVIARNGWTFIDVFFVQQHFARYVSNRYHHTQPFYFYLPIMAMLSAPWTGFLAAGLSRTRHWNWRPATCEDRFRIFSLAWLVGPVIFFSFSKSKLPGYVLPALPGAMFIAGDAITRFLKVDGRKASMLATGAIVLSIGLGGYVYHLRTGVGSTLCILVVIAPLIVSAIITFGWTKYRVLCLASTVFAMFMVMATGLYCAVDKIGKRQSVRDLMQIASVKGYGALPVFELHNIERTAEFYASDRLAYAPDGEPLKLEGANQVADASRLLNGPVLVLVPIADLSQLTQDMRLETVVIGDNGSYALAASRLLVTETLNTGKEPIALSQPHLWVILKLKP